jgi:predicted ATPase/class 3 adenylate cyclase
MSELRALLLTDAVDSTQLAEMLGEAANSSLWAAHDRMARDLLPLWRGREIDKTDGMLLLFDSVRDAVGYGLAYQRELGLRLPALRARTGVHFGPVTLRTNPPADVARGAKPLEVEGMAKAMVARVMSAAAGGQILLTESARQELSQDDTRARSCGHWRLKGLAEPIELFVLSDEEASFALPPGSEKAYRVVRRGDTWTPVKQIPHSLPAERDGFVGRAGPLAELERRIRTGARAVSLLGIGGSGKTRLATRFGWTWLGDYPGGVWFCDLSTARDLDGLLRSVAQGLGLPLGRADPIVQIARAIDGRGRCLVVLDNFEQVASLAEQTLGRWLERAPAAVFVVTTRERLGVVGEEAITLEPMATAEAAALFQQRVQAVQADPQERAADAAAVDQLVGMLDGLPLAIELAAARARVMTPRAMIARMHERFSVLQTRGGRRDRQATLRAAFDWSWDLLGETEKSALAQLSVFVGGFTLESAAAVLEWPGASAEPASALDVVEGLVDKSLVRCTAKGRFDLLQSVRAYAAEQLHTEGRFAGSGPAAAVAAAARHADHFARLGPERAIASACIELENLTAACRHLVACGDGPRAAQALRGATQAILLRGPFRDLPPLAEAVRAVPGLAGRDRVVVELDSAHAHSNCGLKAQAGQLYGLAAAGARALGERSLEARAMCGLASLAAEAGPVEEATALYAAALAAIDDTTDADVRCTVLNGVAAFEEWRGDAQAARAHFEEALRIARAGGARRWEGGLAGNLGGWFTTQGRAAEAQAQYELSIEIARELGDRKFEANARCNLGLLHFDQGRLAEAQRELDASHEAARELGHAQLVAVVRCNLGLLAEAQGQADVAEGHHRAALAVARELGDKRSQGQVLGYLGLLNARRQQFDAARADLSAGQALLESLGDRLSLGVLLSQRAHAEALAGAAAAAETFLARVDNLAREMLDLAPGSEFGRARDEARAALVRG